MDSRYAFDCDWYDAQASLVRKYQIFYYPKDSAIEMFDVKNRRTFLKRTVYPEVTVKDLYIGSTVTIYGRQLKITAFGDDATKKALSQARERTFAMIKPHCFDHLGKILDIISREGFTVDKIQSVQLSRSDASLFYKEHTGKPFFNDLLSMITAGPVVAMELVGPGSILRWRELLGATNPAAAARENPRSIRAMFGVDNTRNAAHGSDSVESAMRELEFFFGRKTPFATTASFDSCTLAIIKPHAVLAGLAGQILDAIINEGFIVGAIELFHLDRASSEEFYEVYKGVVPEFTGMVDALTAGPCIALELRGEDVVPAFRTLSGPPDPEIARHLRPKTIRARFGLDKVQNAVHCTDLPEDGSLEVEYFFKILHGQ